MLNFVNHKKWLLIAICTVSLASLAQDAARGAEENPRLLYRRHDYLGAILSIDPAQLDTDTKWILADSFFRVGRFGEAKTYFEELAASVSGQAEQRKALLRIFECDLRAKNLQEAVNDLVAYKKKFKTAPAIMSYGLGKALYDAGFTDRATVLLRAVPAKSEFGIRARYIEAAVALDNETAKTSVQSFRKIAKMQPRSVEDHAVIEMAKLAVGRIYVDSGRADLAEKAYQQVKLDTKYGEAATIELVRAMIVRAELALHKEGPFKKISAFTSELEQAKAMSSALVAIDRYRKVSEIDWQKPELLTLMALLFGKTKRYDEAELAYNELLGHYRSISQALLKAKQEENKIWPYFALKLVDEKMTRPQFSLILGVPNFLLQDLPELKEVTSMRDKIDESAKTLAELEKKAKTYSLKNAEKDLVQARVNQQLIESAYEKMVFAKQEEIRVSAAGVINEMLAEAEFKRAEITLAKMQDLKKQFEFVRDFQAKSIEMFDKELGQLPKGGAL